MDGEVIFPEESEVAVVADNSSLFRNVHPSTTASVPHPSRTDIQGLMFGPILKEGRCMEAKCAFPMDNFLLALIQE